MKYIICGFMGAGKTTLLQRLEEMTRRECLDLDEQILQERPDCSSIAEIFDREGEVFFRKLELAVLKKVLQRPGDWVLALGGGSLNDESLKLIQSLIQTKTYWLSTEFLVCLERIKDDVHRPLLKNKTMEELKILYDNRVSYYRHFEAKTFEELVQIIS